MTPPDVHPDAGRDVVRSLRFTPADADRDLSVLRERLHARSATVEDLYLFEPRLLDAATADGLRLPALTRLVVPALEPFAAGPWRDVLLGLTGLTALAVERTGAGAAVEVLAAAPWWQRLTDLDLALLDLDGQASGWDALWRGRRFALRTLCLGGLSTADVAAVLAADLPVLEYLVPGGSGVDDGLLDLLAAARLPALEDLELRRAAVSPQAVLRLAAAPPPGLPALRRVGRDFTEDEPADQHDWDGSVVGGAAVGIAEPDAARRFFAGLPVGLLPANHRLSTRGAMMSAPFGPVERVP